MWVHHCYSNQGNNGSVQWLCEYTTGTVTKVTMAVFSDYEYSTATVTKVTMAVFSDYEYSTATGTKVTMAVFSDNVSTPLLQ